MDLLISVCVLIRLQLVGVQRTSDQKLDYPIVQTGKEWNEHVGNGDAPEHSGSRKRGQTAGH